LPQTTTILFESKVALKACDRFEENSSGLLEAPGKNSLSTTLLELKGAMII
jgi:hypothetical protein